MPDVERTPRAYADLLALYEAAPVWVRPDKSQQTGGPGGTVPTTADGSPINLDYFTEQQIADALQIDVLGQTEAGEIEVYSEHLKRVVKFGGLSRIKYADLGRLFGVPVKRCILQSGSDDVPGMFGIRETLTAIGMLSSRRVLSDETKLGAGVWPVRDEASGQDQAAVVLVNSSSAMHFNGTTERISHPRHRGALLHFDSGSPAWYDHDSLAGLLQQASGAKFRETVVDDLICLFRRWRWRGKQDATIAAGLVLATWVQAVWAWRPRIDVLGASNTGKSMLCSALAGLFRDLVILTSDTTAAGLRQKICNSARVVIVDEVDAKNRAKVARQREILEMLRSASRGTAAIRGTGSGKALEFTLRHLVWVAGISLSYDDQADRNRAVLLNLLPPTKDMAGKLRLPTGDELQALGQRSLAAAVWACQEARCAAVGLKDQRIDGVDQRLIESYAVPAAMLASVLGQSHDDAAALLRSLLEDAQTDSHVEPDESSLVADILGAGVQMEYRRLTVGQAIEIAIDVTRDSTARDGWRTVLESCGVKLDLGASPRILLSYQLVRRKLLHGTRWQEQPIDQYLRRIEGGESAIRRVGGTQGRCWMLCLREFEQRYMGDSGQGQDEALPLETQGRF